MKLCELKPNTASTIRRILAEVLPAEKRRYRTWRSSRVDLDSYSPVITNPYLSDTANVPDDQMQDFSTSFKWPDRKVSSKKKGSTRFQGD